MNIEEIKLIVEMLTQLGVESKEAFFWWLLITELIPTIFTSALVCVFFYLSFRLLYNLTKNAKLEEIRDATVGGHSYYDEVDHQKILRWIREVKK